MIVTAKTAEELSVLLGFLLEHAGVSPSVDLHVFGWAEKELKIVVGLGSWIGHTCQMHVAFTPDWHFTPRELLHTVFRHAFIEGKRKLVLGIVNSKNEKAMKYDRHLGFNEMWRIPGMHDHDGDIVVMGMYKNECRYLELIAEHGNA